MSKISLFNILVDSMEKHGADGLYNSDGSCGCGVDWLNPGECMNTGCVLAKSHVVTVEDEFDDCEVGDTVFCPIQVKP